MSQPNTNDVHNRESMTDARRILAWSGGVEDLRRLGQVISKQFPEETSFVKGRRLPLFLYIKRKKTAVSKPVTVTLQLTYKNKKSISGEYQAVLNDTKPEPLDWAEIDEAVFRATTARDDCAIFLSISASTKISGNTPGASFAVSGLTPWVPGAMRSISDEMDHRRPWWHFLRHQVIVFLYYASIYVVGLIGAGLWVDRLPKKTPDLLVPIIIAVYIAAIIAIGFAIAIAARRVFPAAEFSQSGIATTRQKIRRIATSAAGSIVVVLSIVQGILAVTGKK